MANSFTPQQIEEFLQEFFDVVGARQYVGARYVPIFGRAGEDTMEWDDDAPYEPLTVVMHLGVSYVSRRYVPTGIQITDTAYWVETYRFNAQVEQYRQEVLGFSDRIDAANAAVENLRVEVSDEYVPFPTGPNSKYGDTDQVLGTLENGQTRWVDPVTVTAEVAGPLIEDWLDDHPEATTTVQDGSITDAKLVQTGGVLEHLERLAMGNWYHIADITERSLIAQDGTLAPTPDANVALLAIPRYATRVCALNRMTIGGTTYKMASFIAFYDANDTFISLIGGDKGGYAKDVVYVSIPTNARYVRVVQSAKDADKDDVTVGFSFEAAQDVRSSFPLARAYLATTHYLDTNGAAQADSSQNFQVSDYLPISPGYVSYRLVGPNNTAVIAFYDADHTMIATVKGEGNDRYTQGRAFTGYDAAYMRVCTIFNKTLATVDVDDIMVRVDEDTFALMRPLAYNYPVTSDYFRYHYITGAGNTPADPSGHWWSSDYMPVMPGTCLDYRLVGMETVGVITVYDADKHLINSVSGRGINQYTEGWFYVHPNAAYIRVCTLKSQSLSAADLTRQHLVAYPTALTGIRGSVRWLAIGDSITYGDTVGGIAYPDYIASDTGITVLKEGHSGYSMQALYDMRDDFPAAAEIVTVFAGTNDFNGNVPVGTLGDTTNATFHGRVYLMMSYLQATYPTAPVVFMTPIWRNYTGTDPIVQPGMTNATGANLLDYCQAIVDCGRAHGVPVVDLANESGIGQWNLPSMTTDGVHPNARGQRLLAGIFETTIKRYLGYGA